MDFMTHSTRTTRTWVNRILASAGILLMTTSLSGCGGDGGEGTPSLITNAGASATLAWDPVQDPSVTAYYVHYGTRPRSENGDAYDDRVSADSTTATVTNLEPGTTYYFAVTAYNGVESPFSQEVSAVIQ